jgi:arginyl-tRNA synthetase
LVMDLIDQIKQVISETLGANDFVVEHPADEKMGDYALNVAMVAAKKMGKNPRDLAAEMVGKLQENKELMSIVGKIEVAGPGFINIWIKDEVLIGKLDEALKKGDELGDSNFMKDKNVLVEYSSPNIAKRFSVGHLRSTIIGQAIFNLYKHSGAKRVTNDNHIGDWGTQFGMIIAGIEENNDFDWETADINKLEEIYVNFNKEMAENPELRTKAKEAFLRLERGDEAARRIWGKSVEISMKEFDLIYQKLGVDKFDHVYGESAYADLMPGIIEECKKKQISSMGEEGALIVEFVDASGKEMMPPAMLQKSDGSTTYFTRDLATIRMRLDDPELKSNLYVYEVGGEQRLYLKQVFAAAKKLWPEDTKEVDFVHVAHGRMTNEGQAMSTRKGNTIKLEDLLNRAEEKAAGDVALSIGAVKYNELKRSPVMDYDFRWEEAMSMEGNSGPYLQYVYVRTRGILKKTEENEETVKTSEKKFINDDERSLARWLLLRFCEGEVVESAAKSFAPQQICAYLFETAQKFNGFYERNKVIGSENQDLRLVLTMLTGEIIKNGLGLLGIETVEKM